MSLGAFRVQRSHGMQQLSKVSTPALSKNAKIFCKNPSYSPIHPPHTRILMHLLPFTKSTSRTCKHCPRMGGPPSSLRIGSMPRLAPRLHRRVVVVIDERKDAGDDVFVAMRISSSSSSGCNGGCRTQRNPQAPHHHFVVYPCSAVSQAAYYCYYNYL